MAAFLASGTTVPIGAAVAETRPLRRNVLHWASFSGNPNVLTAVLEAVAADGVAAAAASGVVEGDAQAAANASSAAKSDALETVCLSGVGGHDGCTALHLAAIHGYIAVATVLLEAGAVDTSVDQSGATPLALAVRAGHEELVTELLRLGSLSINDTLDDGFGLTAVHIAAEEGHLRLIEMFLREGAAVNVATRPYEQTPLHFAVNCGPNAEVITVALLSAGADVDTCGPDNESALCKASDVAVMRALVLAGATPHWLESLHASPVEIAMRTDNVAELSMFLEAGMDPNHRGPFSKPLPPGASVWERLCHNQFDDHRYGGASLLHRAARWLSAVAVEVLLAAGAREDIPAVTDARQENMPVITTLPADVIGVDVKDMTPELQRRAEAIRSMLAGAQLYRKGWLSMLRARFDAGESLTGSEGAKDSRGGGGNDGVEGSPTVRRNKERVDIGSQDVGGATMEDNAWYGAAVWVASVPGPEVFRIITEYI
eukprot:g10187.t2